MLPVQQATNREIEPFTLEDELVRPRLPSALRYDAKSLPAVNGHVEVPTGGHEKSPPRETTHGVGGGPPPRARAGRGDRQR